MSILTQSLINVTMRGLYPLAIVGGVAYRLVAKTIWYLVVAFLIAELFAVRWFADYAVSDLGWDPGPILLTVVMPGLMFMVGSTLFALNVRDEFYTLKGQTSESA